MLPAIAIAAVLRAANASPSPIRYPIRMVAAMPNAMGGMNRTALMFIEMLCAATTSGPYLPSNNVVKANKPISAKMVAPMGRPTIKRALILCQSGGVMLRNHWVFRKRGRVTTKMTSISCSHMMMACATPHPTPPISGKPKAP